MTSIRFTELNLIANLFFDQSMETNNSDDKTKILLNEINDSSLKTEKIKSNTKKTFSEMINNSFLMEYMFYIFQGIFKIAKEIDNPITINEKCYENKLYHNFKQFSIKSLKDLENLSSYDINETNYIKEKSWIKRLFNLIMCTGKITVTEYAPEIFRKIMQHDGINRKILDDSFNLTKNINNISNLKISEGKSGSFFFFTYDNRFLMKTIPEGEKKALLGEFLKKYYNNINDENNSSLLGRIYGLYTLKIGFFSSINLILMENICPISSDFVTRRFDLKGSLLGRETTLGLKNNSSKTLKDKDFLDLKRMNPDLIVFNQDDIDDIESMMRRDIEILSNSRLMDYSFFITVVKRADNNFERDSLILKNRVYYSKDMSSIYFIGIIDYLTKFNIWKKIEFNFKGILNYSERCNISAVEPEFYSLRFFNYMSQEIFSRKNNLHLFK